MSIYQFHPETPDEVLKDMKHFERIINVIYANEGSWYEISDCNIDSPNVDIYAIETLNPKAYSVWTLSKENYQNFRGAVCNVSDYSHGTAIVLPDYRVLLSIWVEKIKCSDIPKLKEREAKGDFGKLSFFAHIKPIKPQTTDISDENSTNPPQTDVTVDNQNSTSSDQQSSTDTTQQSSEEDNRQSFRDWVYEHQGERAPFINLTYYPDKEKSDQHWSLNISTSGISFVDYDDKNKVIQQTVVPILLGCSSLIIVGDTRKFVSCSSSANYIPNQIDNPNPFIYQKDTRTIEGNCYIDYITYPENIVYIRAGVNTSVDIDILSQSLSLDGKLVSKTNTFVGKLNQPTILAKYTSDFEHGLIRGKCSKEEVLYLSKSPIFEGDFVPTISPKIPLFGSYANYQPLRIGNYIYSAFYSRELSEDDEIYYNLFFIRTDINTLEQVVYSADIYESSSINYRYVDLYSDYCDGWYDVCELYPMIYIGNNEWLLPNKYLFRIDNLDNPSNLYIMIKYTSDTETFLGKFAGNFVSYYNNTNYQILINYKISSLDNGNFIPVFNNNELYLVTPKVIYRLDEFHPTLDKAIQYEIDLPDELFHRLENPYTDPDDVGYDYYLKFFKNMPTRVYGVVDNNKIYLPVNKNGMLYYIPPDDTITPDNYPTTSDDLNYFIEIDFSNGLFRELKNANFYYMSTESSTWFTVYDGTIYYSTMDANGNFIFKKYFIPEDKLTTFYYEKYYDYSYIDITSIMSYFMRLNSNKAWHLFIPDRCIADMSDGGWDEDEGGAV